MVRPSVHAAPIIRNETVTDLQQVVSVSPGTLDEDLPKLFNGDDDTDARDPRYAKFSKVLISQASKHKALTPCKLSDYCCDVGQFPSPLRDHPASKSMGLKFVSDDETILVDIISHGSSSTISREFVRGGPREYLAFHPKTQVKACVVTCGGLCPGLNFVLRELVNCLMNMYGVKEVWGIPFGYRGFYSTNMNLIRLNEDIVRYIHHEGGSFIGSSRGGHDTNLICDAIQSYGFNNVFIIGGDGTHRGAVKIADELEDRGARVCVVGIPKTIDNDIALIDKSFGFDTAVEEATKFIRCATVEARSGINGIGLVKLMGRHSGQIAMFATLASREVDCCLIPEVAFSLEGPKGLYRYIESCFEKQGHCTIVVAEGAGMDLMQQDESSLERDKSGNVKLPCIATWLKARINTHFKKLDMEVNLKLLDPMYAIRSIIANASDSLYCGLLAQTAVHGALAGFTRFTVGLINTHFCLIDMKEIASRPRVRVSPESRMWHRVLASTGQPDLRAERQHTYRDPANSFE